MFISHDCEHSVLVLPDEVITREEILLSGTLRLDGSILEYGGEFALNCITLAQLFTKSQKSRYTFLGDAKVVGRLHQQDLGVNEKSEGVRGHCCLL
jgi:hypothetical protein